MVWCFRFLALLLAFLVSMLILSEQSRGHALRPLSGSLAVLALTLLLACHPRLIGRNHPFDLLRKMLSRCESSSKRFVIALMAWAFL